MEFFKKRSVALTVLLLAIIGGIVIGQMKKPQTPDFDPSQIPTEFSYVYDYADILTTDTENYITRMNNALFGSCGAQILVVTVPTYEGDLYEYAMNLGDTLGIGDIGRDNGTVLLLDTENGDDEISGAVAVQGDGLIYALTDDTLDRILEEQLAAPFYAHDYDRGVADTFDALIRWYEDYYRVDLLPKDKIEYNPVPQPIDPIDLSASCITTVLFLYLIWWIIDSIRYKRYRRRYWQPGMGVPPVVYRPVFRGYHMGHRPPPPVPPDITPHSGGGSFTGSPRGGGFGGASRNTRSGGGGSFTGSPRGGGFGGASGNTRSGGGGSFTGSPRGGGFGGASGNTRSGGGGSFTGPSRGGGFGGGARPSGGSSRGSSRGGGIGRKR